MPRKEGLFRQDTPIADIINPRSDVIILHDNNLTADPHCLDKLREIRERGLMVDIDQGIDVRLLTAEIARELSRVRHLRSIHYAWDLMQAESDVMRGIRTLSQYIRPYRQMCFVLTGYNTTLEEDMYRIRRLEELKVSPYVMVYNERSDATLKQLERWVNGRFLHTVSFEEYQMHFARKPKRTTTECLNVYTES